MIQTDQRRRLRQPIPLHHRVSQPMPELFRLAIQRRAPADHRPEFPSKLPPHSRKRPPPPQKMLALASASAARQNLSRRPPVGSSSRSRSIFCFSDSIIRGTATSTETRSRRIVAITSDGLKVFSNTTVPPSSGGRNIPRNCPKTWLSGSRFKNRIGCTSRSYFRYFLISVSIGSQIADDVGVSEHDALRLGRRARSKNNFKRIGRLNFHRTKALEPNAPQLPPARSAGSIVAIPHFSKNRKPVPADKSPAEFAPAG